MIQPIKSSLILDSPLLSEYEKECAISLLGPCSPNREMYQAMEDSGILKCFGVFREAYMTGFATVLITVYPHYSKKVATVESLYTSDGEGSALMSAVKSCARESGCSEILYSAPVGGRFEKLLQASRNVTRTSSVFGEKL